MLVKVKNIHGSSGRCPSGYRSWEDFWCEKTGKQWPRYCCTDGCGERAAVGAHVKKVGSPDNRWFIVPLCYHHNNDHDAEFWVQSDLLVPVNL